VTSDKCYEDQPETSHLTEADPLGGSDPYSSSKACVELLTRAFLRSYWNSGNSGVGIATARAGNCIGGGDWAQDRLIPDFVRASSVGRPLKLGNPRAIRPWQHVLEPLHGYLLLVRRLWDDPAAFSGPWNFGTGAEESRTVEWIVAYLSQLWEGVLPWSVDPDMRPNEVETLMLDYSMAKTRLDWIPRWDIEKCLERTIAWYRHHLDDPDSIQRFSYRQIDEYLTG
jgi:CDP-glucose 4,6-dehydratase